MYEVNVGAIPVIGHEVIPHWGLAKVSLRDEDGSGSYNRGSDGDQIARKKRQMEQISHHVALNG